MPTPSMFPQFLKAGDALVSTVIVGGLAVVVANELLVSLEQEVLATVETSIPVCD